MLGLSLHRSFFVNIIFLKAFRNIVFKEKAHSSSMLYDLMYLFISCIYSFARFYTTILTLFSFSFLYSFFIIIYSIGIVFI